MIAPVVNVGVVGVRVPQGLVPVRMAVRLPRWIVRGVPVSVVFVVDVHMVVLAPNRPAAAIAYTTPRARIRRSSAILFTFD